jgi:hypothetical protein
MTLNVLLFLVMSVVLSYLLYKLYAYTRQRAILWFCKMEVPAPPTDVIHCWAW